MRMTYKEFEDRKKKYFAKHDFDFSGYLMLSNTAKLRRKNNVTIRLMVEQFLDFVQFHEGFNGCQGVNIGVEYVLFDLKQ